MWDDNLNEASSTPPVSSRVIPPITIHDFGESKVDKPIVRITTPLSKPTSAPLLYVLKPAIPLYN